MLATELNRDALTPSFEGDESAPRPALTKLSCRKAYYRLVNVHEYPDVLPLAYDLVTRRLAEAPSFLPGGIPPGDAGGLEARLADVIERLDALRDRFARPWRQDNDDLTRRQVLHYFVQYMPMALVDGCWLQCGLRVATAHTAIGASLTGLYQHQVRAFVADPGRHFVADYREVYRRLGAPVEEVSSLSFAERADFQSSSFAVPIFALAIAQVTRSFPLEILGLNLAWQFLDLSAFGPDLVRDACQAYALPPLGDDLNAPDHLETGRHMARAAALGSLERVDGSRSGEAWSGLLRGVSSGVELWTRWLNELRESAPSGPPDPRQEMIDLLRRKSPHAFGYHGDRRLGARRIDEMLDPAVFNGPAVLDALAASPWVKTGKSGKSVFLSRLTGFGGPMLAVFSPVEQEIVQKWIDSLSTDVPAESAASRPAAREEEYVEGRTWDAIQLRRSSERRYGKIGVRELYHYLINVEFFPDVLPMAERFAHERLERSLAMIWKGERPIPSRRYDPAALEQWVYRKHREQVDSYRPPDVRPEAPRAAFIEATVQLAPLILIDGGWLQGMASPALIHTPVGRMLFHVLVEELGEGSQKEHHANVYRDLLKAMGEDPPPVDSWEFARWPRLLDASFDVPTLWLSISCFPRHFLPEILGLNLAVELAGVGGPYMEARDTLRRFRYPTLFVDVHNAADNVSVGHSAWAMNAIRRYLDEVADRDGPHNVDRAWHRIWAGVRATLPQIGRARMIGHRLQRRFFGEDPTLVPLIFPA